MKKLLTLFAVLAMLAFAGCESLGDDNVVGGSYSINGAIQKGPFIQGSNITIQPLNKNLKPIGQMYTTQTTNDAGMFEMDDVNSKYAEIIATGYYFDEVEGKISAAPLTLRSIADLKDGTQTNVNLLTSLTYNRIKNLVTNEGKDISEAQSQAEKELYTTLGIPEELQPNVNCGAMNISNNGEGDGLLLALSAILQEGRSVGELTEYISKFSTDLADDGQVSSTLLDKFNLDGQHLLRFEERIKENLTARYEDLGVECNIPNFLQYLSYLGNQDNLFVIPFTYYENVMEAMPSDPTYAATQLKGIEEKFHFDADVEYLGYGCYNGYGEIYLSAAPTVINRVSCDVLGTIEIPDSVTKIGEAAFNCCYALRSITIPDSVTEIGETAFSSCFELASASIGNGVTTIGDYAYSSCYSLTNVTIGNNVRSIGRSAFQYCTSLTTITIPDSVTEVGNYAFENCSSLTNITIPDSVTSIGHSVFWFCNKLVSASIGDGITAISQNAFGRCTSLTSVSIGNSVRSIGEEAFDGCSSLANITIPDNVTEIGDGAFGYCTSLTNISIGNGVTLIGSSAFENCASLTNIIIPDSVTSIEEMAFYECVSLTSINIPDSVTSIGGGAFGYCTSLTSVTISDSVTSIGDVVFACCTSLASINIPDSVTSIGEGAFGYCTSLTSITIPDSVTSIEQQAFFYCSSLSSVYCKPTTPPTPMKLQSSWFAFDENPLDRKIYVPTDSVKRYKGTIGWRDYADSIVGYDFE